MKKPYHIVTRAARESAAVIEQFCQANGQILLPLVNLIQSASQVVETVIHEIGQQTLEIDFLKGCLQRIEEQRMLQASNGNPQSTARSGKK